MKDERQERMLFDSIPFGFPTYIISHESFGNALEENQR